MPSLQHRLRRRKINSNRPEIPPPHTQFSDNSRPVDRLELGLGSEPHVVGPLRSGPRAGAGVISWGVFSVGGCLRASCLQGGGGYLLELKLTANTMVQTY